MNSKHKKIVEVSVILLVLIATVVLSIWRITPPRADDSSPSFTRMMYNLERLATGERWVGTPEVAAARDEIIAEIEAMGLTPYVHRTAWTLMDQQAANLRIFELRTDWDVSFGDEWEDWMRDWVRERHPNHPLVTQGYMYVDNIWVTIESRDPDAGNIMFVAHYDTWPDSPGAGDAMLPAVAMLEAMRVHANNGNTASNLHFLFTDGEEFSALGAFAFSRDFPEMVDEIDVLINMEAIGTSGGVINFEVSRAPHNMIRMFNRAVPRPIGFHWGTWLYATSMPGSYTDFTIFLDYGFTGLNFAIIGDGHNYHTPNDSFENICPNAAWHYMSMVMALTDYAATNSVAGLGEPSSESVFFPFLPWANMIIMTATVANILTGLAFAIAIGFLVYNFMAKLEKSQFVSIIIIVLIIASAVALVFVSLLSYLLWIPLLVVSAAAFLKTKPILYKCAMTLAGIITLLLLTPPVYLFFQLIPNM